MDHTLRLLSRSPRGRAAIAFLAALALVAFSSAAALAATRSYNGPAATGHPAGVEFGAHFKKGQAISVYRFEYHNIPAQCQGYGTTATTDKLDLTMTVNSKRKFGAQTTLNGGKVTVKVHGRFSKNYSTVSGTLRVHGTIPGCAAADTGKVQWHA
jgi:hypothetical protein